MNERLMNFRLRAIIAALVALLVGAHARGTMTIEIDAGHLYSTNDTTGCYLTTGSDGALLQVLVSMTGTFAAPTAGSYTGGDSNEMVIANLAMNDFAGTDESDSTFTFTLCDNIQPGDALLLRWYPDLSLDDEQAGATPDAGMCYGQFEGSAEDSEGGLAWVLPADGSNDTGSSGLFFLTQDSDGDDPESSGIAAMTVMADPVPEPGMIGLTSIGLLLGGIAAKRRGKGPRAGMFRK